MKKLLFLCYHNLLYNCYQKINIISNPNPNSVYFFTRRDGKLRKLFSSLITDTLRSFLPVFPDFFLAFPLTFVNSIREQQVICRKAVRRRRFPGIRFCSWIEAVALKLPLQFYFTNMCFIYYFS